MENARVQCLNKRKVPLLVPTPPIEILEARKAQSYAAAAATRRREGRSFFVYWKTVVVLVRHLPVGYSGEYLHYSLGC